MSVPCIKLINLTIYKGTVTQGTTGIRHSDALCYDIKSPYILYTDVSGHILTLSCDNSAAKCV